MASSCGKKLSSLLREIASKHDGDFYCLNCFHLFRTKNKLESHEKVWENKDYCNVVIPSEDTETLEFNQYHKSDADLESLIEKIDGYKNNPENSSTTKANEHIPPGFLVSTISLFKAIEYKHNVYSGKDCMKAFCESLRECAMKMINFEKKKMRLLANEQQKSYENAKICYICKEKFEDKYAKDKEYCKDRYHCHYTGEYRSAAHSIFNLKYIAPIEIPIVFYNGSNYDYHFNIKKLAEKFERLLV